MAKKANKIFEKEIVRTVQYFNYFQYTPSFDQIRQFLPFKVSIGELKQSHDYLVKNNQLLTFKVKLLTLYTMPPYRIYFNYWHERGQETLYKEGIVRKYLDLIQYLPQIKLVGFSGSMALYNAKKNDDIDLFVITAKNRLWTGRFLMILLAIALKIKRSLKDNIAPNKVCLNMFFDALELAIPQNKRNIYTAHEVLQMRPVIIKSDIYQQFIEANKWVFKYFPNAEDNVKCKTKNVKLKIQHTKNLYIILHFTLYVLSFVSTVIEYFLKSMQLYLINRHKTSEIVTSTQLWFFPDDFEKTLIKTDLLTNLSKIGD